MEFVEHVEGSTRLVVPSVSLTADPPPTAPVFFNPAASLNRDISVAITAAAAGTTFCDSMSGVGARGLRVANEVKKIEKVTMVDFNSAALKAARRGADLNEVSGRCEFSDSETSTYLHSRQARGEKFDFVDLDPFGTPIRQLQAALFAVSSGGVISITATDTAALCGVYPTVSRRRYGAASLNNGFHHETGIRILAGALAREGARSDLGIEPVLAHSTRHYIRLFARVTEGASRADRSLERTGYVIACSRCGHVSSSETIQELCLSCGKRAKMAGPLWLYGLADPRILERSEETGMAKGLASAAKLMKSLEGVNDYPPWSFSIEKASSALGKATPSESEVREVLREGGWSTMRTPFEKTGMKTKAPYAEFLRAVERCSVEATSRLR